MAVPWDEGRGSRAPTRSLLNKAFPGSAGTALECTHAESLCIRLEDIGAGMLPVVAKSRLVRA